MRELTDDLEEWLNEVFSDPTPVSERPPIDIAGFWNGCCDIAPAKEDAK